ncbi:hypothetical protein [Paenibacillus tengchongensis]|uniref:hypothetical protein n=1 Tax=Paenibacillus tengchongensis TaxID=2608684 RepID=UPI00124C322F|nr:hypothetical protein [Paenibacillus tengchongensis]
MGVLLIIGICGIINGVLNLAFPGFMAKIRPYLITHLVPEDPAYHIQRAKMSLTIGLSCLIFYVILRLA